MATVVSSKNKVSRVSNTNALTFITQPSSFILYCHPVDTGAAVDPLCLVTVTPQVVSVLSGAETQRGEEMAQDVNCSSTFSKLAHLNFCQSY